VRISHSWRNRKYVQGVVSVCATRLNKVPSDGNAWTTLNASSMK